MKLSQCEILDTWYTTGLRGTGSNDLLVKDVFVPAEHTFSFQDKNLIKRPGPLYAFPFMFAAKSSPVALGIARHALDVLIETATNKTARRYTLGEHLEPPKMMRDDVFIQEAVGRAEMMLTSARAHLFEVIGDFWATLVEGRATRPRAGRPLHHASYLRRRRLRGCGAACVQGGRRHGGLPEGTARSLSARRPDHEPARGRDHANLRDGGTPVAWHGAAEVAVLVPLCSRHARSITKEGS